VDRDDADPEAVAAAVEVARGRGDRFVLNLRAGRDDRFLPLARTLGLVPMGEHPWMPGMALHPIPDVLPVPPAGHEIRRVTDDAGVEDHVQVASAGFGMPVRVVRSIVDVEIAKDPSTALYVGSTDGVAVTSGLGVRTGRAIGIYNVATREAARRKGYAEAMTRRIAADGAALGCDVAVLQASEMGRPIYERLGYRTVVEYVGYVEPGS